MADPTTAPSTLAQSITLTLQGLEGRQATVEVDLRPGLPSMTIIGRADAAVRESRERIHCALLNSGFQFPQRRITANLAPARLRRDVPSFDLALACGILAASGQVAAKGLAEWATFGDLALSGELRPLPGTLLAAERVRRLGLRGIIVPTSCGAEAALVEGIEVAEAATLRDVAEILSGEQAPHFDPLSVPPTWTLPDFADVRGHAAEIRALQIAAAGNHSVLLSGPAGSGRTLLARRLPSIMAPLTPDEALEVTRIQSIAGLCSGGALADQRPFRAPHHSVSPIGVVGGGVGCVLGEATLAHRGVLYLDEINEVSRVTIEMLAPAIADGQATIVRGGHASVLPTEALLVASVDLGPSDPSDRRRWLRRLSTPLIESIDLKVDVRRPISDELEAPPVTTSEEARARVVAAIERKAARGGTLPLDGEVAEMLCADVARGSLSPRGRDRVEAIAETIADLDGAPSIGTAQAHEARALYTNSYDKES